MADACPSCQHTHVAGDVAALGRFAVGPVAYRTPDGATDQTRAEAQDYLCRKRQVRTPAADLCDRCGGHLRDGICTDYCDALDCGCGRDDRTNPHEFGPGCEAWDDQLDANNLPVQERP